MGYKSAKLILTFVTEWDHCVMLQPIIHYLVSKSFINNPNYIGAPVSLPLPRDALALTCTVHFSAIDTISVSNHSLLRKYSKLREFYIVLGR